MKYIIVFVTVPAKNYKKVVNHVLNKKLVACVNVIKDIQSFYWWEEKICSDKESLLIMKTTSDKFSVLVGEIKKVHPYKVPEIISLDIFKGNKEYLSWINEVLK
ncbi:MAG: divalent-cation tolerance protein CutA [Endomicrobia bacterium]|nr:divalent-cation tolerance protein CutA [Endomicrobiia bacterium]MCX7941008.1 divalent-cation tolerance protein CutA [Endomicrobiia bacterium]MDW8055419.1 divalent-cation tolerance protein CutA [Elusimicrobiota bacterium]